MTFPAELSFKRDTALTPTARRVYDYLTTTLDFRAPRHVKTQIECGAVKTDRETFSNALDALTEAGYLVEHERGPRGIRSFTLAWSLPQPDASDRSEP